MENLRAVVIQAGNLSAEQTSQGNISLCIFKILFCEAPRTTREVSLCSGQLLVQRLTNAFVQCSATNGPPKSHPLPPRLRESSRKKSGRIVNPRWSGKIGVEHCLLYVIEHCTHELTAQASFTRSAQDQAS